MAINAKNIQGFLWRTLKFSMKSCYIIVKRYSILSLVSTFFVLLYMFLPSAFIFFICSLPVFALAAVGYRVYFCRIDYKGSKDVKSYKKTDDKPPILKDNDMGNDDRVSGHGQTIRRRNANENDRENCTQNSIEDKSIVCPTESNDKLIDKTAVVEENEKEIREVKVDSVDEKAGSLSPGAAPIVASPPFTSGCVENSAQFLGAKAETEGESSESSEEEEASENRHKVVEWSADDQWNLMHLGNSETERDIRLENLIARRSARKLYSMQVRNTLMRPATNHSRDPIPSITISRNNLYHASDSDTLPIPGSAPSVLLPMHRPFDIPYDPQEERPNLTGDSFDKEFLVDQQKDPAFCRHESFSLGTFNPVEATKGRSFPDFSFKHGPPETSETCRMGSQSDANDIEEERKSSRKNEARSNYDNVSHTIQEDQASERVLDSVDDQEEDGNEVQTKQILHENYNDVPSSSSSTEETIPLSGANKAELLRSFSSLAQRDTGSGRYDDDRVNDASYSSDRLLFEKTKDNHYFGDKEMHHAPSNSLASDMQVEISEVGSPKSTSSDEKSLIYDAYINKEIASGGEDMWPVSVHLSGVDANESKSRAVNEVSERDIIDVGFSRINDDLDPNTSNLPPEKVVEQDYVTPHSQSSNLAESTEYHTMDLKPKHPSGSDSTDAPSAHDSKHSTTEAVAHTSNSENLEEATPQEVNVVNESVVHDNDGKESLNSSEVIEPKSMEEVSIPADKTNNNSPEDIPADGTSNKSLNDTDNTLDKHSDLNPTKASNRNDDSLVPIRDEHDPSSQNMCDQEGSANYHDNESGTIENEANRNSEFVKDTEVDAELSVKHVDAPEQSSSSNSKSIQVTDENASKAIRDDNAVGQSKNTEGIKDLHTDVKNEELQEASTDKVIKEQMTDDAKDNMENIKVVEGESRTLTPN